MPVRRKVSRRRDGSAWDSRERKDATEVGCDAVVMSRRELMRWMIAMIAL